MSWGALRDLGLTVRPFAGIKPPEGGVISRFDSSLSTTLDDLGRELRQLQAEQVVVELDVRERDIRLDGYPRADARTQGNPGVAISFNSKHGPLRYATAEFQTWQDNLRAIALSMEALRKVDRYGVSKRGEQYAGWKQLPTSTDPADAIQTAEQAWRVIATAAGVPVDSSPLLNGISQKEAIRMAQRATHPDTGGDPDEFRKVMRAKELLAG